MFLLSCIFVIFSVFLIAIYSLFSKYLMALLERSGSSKSGYCNGIPTAWNRWIHDWKKPPLFTSFAIAPFKSRNFFRSLGTRTRTRVGNFGIKGRFLAPRPPCNVCCGGSETAPRITKEHIAVEVGPCTSIENNSVLTNTLMLPIARLVPPSSQSNSRFSAGIWLADIRFALSRQTFPYPDIRKSVLLSPRITSGINAVVESENHDSDITTDQLRRKLASLAGTYLSHMSATISNVVIRLTGWFLTNILRRFLTGILVSQSQIEQLRIANTKNLPIVYLPLHRSHLDYILLTLVLWKYDIKAPHVASGDNLNFSGFGWLLRRLGAFFIRRRLDEKICSRSDGGGSVEKKDHVYRAVLQSYMEELLIAGESVEFFVEGTRSRTGKSLSPKAGLMSVLVETYLEGKIPDALLVGVSYSYERVLDVGIVEELLGKQKKRESLWAVAQSVWTAIGSHYGSVRVDFATPVSLKSMISGLESTGLEGSVSSASLDSSASFVNLCSRQGIPMSPENKRKVIASVCQHVLYDATQNAAITKSQLLAALFLTKYSQGAMLSDLAVELHWLVEEMWSRGRDVIGYSPPSETDPTQTQPLTASISPSTLQYAANAVLDSAKLLGSDLVDIDEYCEKDDMGRNIRSDSGIVSDVPNGTATEVVADVPPVELWVYLTPATDTDRGVQYLKYFKNGMMSAVIIDSVLACAFLSFRPEDEISENELIKRSAELCDLLKNEFILNKPCESIEMVLKRELETRFLRGNRKLLETDEEFVEEVDSETDEAVILSYPSRPTVFPVPHNAFDSDRILTIHKDDSVEAKSVLGFYRDLGYPYMTKGAFPEWLLATEETSVKVT